MNTYKINRVSFPWITFWICIAGLLASTLHLDRLLEFQPSHPFTEPYRIIACHLAHWSWSHVGWSLGSFAALGALCELRDRRTFALCTALSATVIPLLLVVIEPRVKSYRGMSGIDSAFFALLAFQLVVTRLRSQPGIAIAAATLIIAFGLKVFYEQFFHVAVFADSAGAGFVPVPGAHLAGAAVGAIIACRGCFLNTSTFFKFNWSKVRPKFCE